MTVFADAFATDLIDDAPDISSANSIAPWNNIGATTSPAESSIGSRIVWHKVFTPGPGALVVTQNPSLVPTGVLDGGDTYLHVVQGPADGSELTDATLGLNVAIYNNDDGGGALKGMVTIPAAPGGVWFYIGSRSYGGGDIANQWVQVTLPRPPVTAWGPAAELDPTDTGHELATPILSRRERIPAYQSTGVIDAGADAEPLTGQIWPR